MEPLIDPRWQRIEEIFEAALDLPPEERPAYLDRVCEDQELRGELERLLAADAKAEGFLDPPSIASTMAIPAAAAPPEAIKPAPGEVLAGRFRVVRFIASGGMGEVYEAEDLELGQRVAIKTVRSEIVADAAAMDRFRREVRLARQVTHPSVCRSFDIFHHRPDPSSASGSDAPALTFLSMELLQGETLSDRLRRRGRLSPAEALPIVDQITSALAVAHDQGIVHRDLKSANVVLEPRQRGLRVVVTDFGLARLGEGSEEARITATGMVLGTPAYMAPEQLQGGEITAATDVYALGVLMYEMVTGRLPFEGQGAMAMSVRRITEEPPTPRSLVEDLDRRWERTILRCLRRQPEQRFATVGDVARSLAGESVTAVPSGQARLRWVPAALLAFAVLVVVVWGALRPASETEPSLVDVTPRRAVAVLGFKNLSGRDDSAWLATALAEMLTTELAAGEQLRAIPGENVARMKLELALPEVASLARDTLVQIRRHLDSDLLVMGSYFVSAAGAGSRVRVDLRLEDVASGETIALFTEEGSEAELLELVSRSGRRLRDELGIASLSDTDAGRVRAALPGRPEAARLYARGLAQLRLFDALQARELLSEAARLEPEAALVHAALAEAWSALGYDAEAAAVAKRAFDLSLDLVREERLLVEGRYRQAIRAWDRAIEIYRALSEFFPDNVEYGLRLAAVHTAAGRGDDALATLVELRRLPAAAGEPRIALAEARAAYSLSDFRRARTAAEQAVEHGESRGARWLAAHGHLEVGRSRWRLGELDAAADAARDAERLYVALGDRAGVADVLNLLANVAENRGQLEEAATAYKSALSTYRQIGHQAGEATVLNNLALVLDRQGDQPGARALHEQALAIDRAIDNKQGVALVLHNLAMLQAADGDLAGAEEHYSQALAIAREIGDRSQETRSLASLGSVLRRRGDLDGAYARYQESLAIAREIGDRQGIGIRLSNLAIVLWQRGDLDGAVERVRESLAVIRELGDPARVARRLNNLAFLLHKRGDLADAEQAYEEAAEIHLQIDDPGWRARVLSGWGNLLLTRGELAAARQRFEEGLALRRELGGSERIAIGQQDLAALALAEGEPEAAAAFAGEAAAELAAGGSGDGEIATRLLLAQAQLRSGRPGDARRAVARAQELASGSQDPEIRQRLLLVAAEVEAAAGETEAAVARLEAALAESLAVKLAELGLEARLALAEIALTTGAVDARGRLASVATDARAKGFALIAARASAAQTGVDRKTSSR